MAHICFSYMIATYFLIILWLIFPKQVLRRLLCGLNRIMCLNDLISVLFTRSSLNVSSDFAESNDHMGEGMPMKCMDGAKCGWELESGR